MDEKIIVALIGLTGGAIGSLFAPWANWGIEKRKQKLIYRRELVAKWRAMVEDIHAKVFSNEDREYDGGPELIERHKDFYSLKPHLKDDIIKRLDDWDYFGDMKLLVDEIARIEKEWRLV